MSGIVEWFNRRFPLRDLMRDQLTEYYAPKNFNIWFIFGSLALFVLVIQIVSGIFLLVHYQANAAQAFDSIQTIMYDVRWGWLIRYVHTTGASFFFIVIYLHMYRALLYGSFKSPRELIWLIGFVIYMALCAEAYLGYVLPYGNMSFWGAKVITSIIAAIPLAGDWLVSLARGSVAVGTETLNRFMAWHVVLVPLLLIVLVVAHVMALHQVGSNNPDGVEIHDHPGPGGRPLDGIPFHPYYTVKDLFGVGVFLLLFFIVILFAPTLKGWFIEYDNYVPANVLKTPADIRPAWYLSPFYAMLRAVPNKLGGIMIIGAAMLPPLLLPWLDRNRVKSARYRPVYYGMVVMLGLSFIALGWIGTLPASPGLLWPTRIFVVLYFLFFIALPVVSRLEPTRPVPQRLTMR